LGQRRLVGGDILADAFEEANAGDVFLRTMLMTCSTPQPPMAL
jgi:hypothetical protein